MKWLNILKDARKAGAEMSDLTEALKGLDKLRGLMKASPEWGSVEKEFDEFVAALKTLASDF